MRLIIQLISIAALLAVISAAQIVAAQSYKCKSADGRIEYSDRPCAPDKDMLSKPPATGITSKPVSVGIQQLQNLFTEYEDRLCEREKIFLDINKAIISGDIRKPDAALKVKQERLNFLNDTQTEFQDKASKIVKIAGGESDEATALRKYQRKVKECGKPKVAETPMANATSATSSAAPSATPAAATKTPTSPKASPTKTP